MPVTVVPRRPEAPIRAVHVTAYAWADEWVRHGWATSSDPIVGSVAWFPYNHVAYVQSVNGDGTVTIEEYNQNSDHSYHVRVIPNGSAIYLYPPV